MKRYPDWASRLKRFLDERREQPFTWGVNDCALFVCDAVRDMTGTDLAEMVRCRYSTEEEARALLSKLTGGYLREYASQIARRHSLGKADWRHLGRGDVGFIETEAGGALAIVGMDGRHLMMPGDAGMQEIPIRIAKTGWRIG